ncbi:hypothetical protein [Proteus mirabilis]|uniref:hypothetical protein n=1 Tax=Proteus mirabilis TaxID=584 RepID=UPI0023F96783|nr:hypothetical protein [Proteus mirabilis]MDF7192469.1 hypothetical protein [Proteus mirabilis]MDF7386169.1 hypothetical protein [Proteus mirabilis]
MDKSRQQFEAWRSKNKSSTINLFDVWQASRESLESQIKPHQFSQLVNDTKDAAIKYKDCQCLRDALSRVMRDSLISNGVKIKNE